MDVEQANVIRVIVDLVEDLTQDWGLDLEGPIGPETSLVEELEFTSVDVIQLCVAIEEHYGQSKMGFQDLLMREGRYVDDLSVGQFAEFLLNKLETGVTA